MIRAVARRKTVSKFVSVLAMSMAWSIVGAEADDLPRTRLVAGDIAFVARINDKSRVAATVTNYGFIGNNFISRNPSLEYPRGTGFEHMPNGGLWFGARTSDAQGAFTGVTTATLDIAQGRQSPSATEFTPSGTQIFIRSAIPNTPFYDPLAVSEEDLYSDYDDLTEKRADNNPESHRPLGVRVRQYNYAWSLDGYDDMLFIRYVIKSVSETLTDAWVGINTQFASGPKNAYSNWPPSSFGSPLGSWYNKKWLEYDAPLRLLREHYCQGSPVPGGCNLQLVPHWIGLKLLTPPDPASSQQVTVAGWNWSPGNAERDTDVERYAIMSAGSIQDVSQFLPILDDPVELIALGPFPSIAPGDSITVDFALVGGSDVADIQTHARAAQEAYDLGFAIGTTPTRISLVDTHASVDGVQLVWHAPAGAGFAVQVEKLEERGEWRGVGRAVSDAFGRIAFEDRAVVSGERYAYRLVWQERGQEVRLDEVWVEVPAMVGFGLRGLSPNPATAGDFSVGFTLGRPGVATIEVFDVSGRRVLARSYGAVSAGSHTVRLDGQDRLGPGVYMLRLTQGGRQAFGRGIIVR